MPRHSPGQTGTGMVCLTLSEYARGRLAMRQQLIVIVCLEGEAILPSCHGSLDSNLDLIGWTKVERINGKKPRCKHALEASCQRGCCVGGELGKPTLRQ